MTQLCTCAAPAPVPQEGSGHLYCQLCGYWFDENEWRVQTSPAATVMSAPVRTNLHARLAELNASSARRRAS